MITLAIAYASLSVVILFGWNEYGYDRWIHRPDETFRILLKHTEFEYEGNRYSDRIPERIYRNSKDVLLSRCKVLERQEAVVSGKLFQDQVLHAVDPDVQKIFSFSMTEGTLTAFRTTQSGALLSASKAFELFGNHDVVGKKIGLICGSDTIDLNVAGVFVDFPSNTHESFNFFIRHDSSNLARLHVDPQDAGAYGRAAGKSLIEIEASLNKLLAASSNSSIATSDNAALEVQPLPDIYFGRRVVGESARHGDRYSVLILICIVSLIALLAFTNFINLTTLTLPNRSIEIAIRKVAGGTRRSVLWGLALESLVVVIVALVMSVLTLAISFPWLRELLPMDLPGFLFTQLLPLVLTLPTMILMTIIGPLIVARRFASAAPSRLMSSDRITFPRFKRIIAVLQLGISLSLIVSGIVVQRQITRSLVKEPGRNKDQIVYFSYPPDLTDRGRASLAKDWKANNFNIEGLSAASHLPNEISSKVLRSPFFKLRSDYDFHHFFRYPLVNGRWFGPQDTLAVAVNKMGAQLLDSLDVVMNRRVIGTLGNLVGVYNQSEKPVVIEPGAYYDFNYLCVRIIEVDVRETVQYLERKFELKRGEVKFLDRKFETWLVYEDHLGALCGMLAVISLLMSGCAIYGLSLSTGNDKIKQMAIHKMMGASYFDVLRLLMGAFMIPLFVAALAFGFVTYIGLKEWLRTFIYQAHVGIMEALIAIGFCILIITVTAMRQARKLNGSSLTEWLRR